jgi:hypothetical protein
MKLEDLEEGKWYHKTVGRSIIYAYVEEVRFIEMDVYFVTFTVEKAAYIERDTIERTQKESEYIEGINEKLLINRIFTAEKINIWTN